MTPFRKISLSTPVTLLTHQRVWQTIVMDSGDGDDVAHRRNQREDRFHDFGIVCWGKTISINSREQMKPIVISNASNKKVQTRISRIPDIEVAKYMLFFASQISIKYFYCGKIICDKSIFPLIFSVCHVVSISSIHDDRLPHSLVLQVRDWSGQRDLTKR